MPELMQARQHAKFGLAAEVLRSTGTLRLQAAGTSMLPTLWPGDILTIENAAAHDTRPGEIVLVAGEDRFFVHRLIEKRGRHMVTRGDAMPQDDPGCDASQVLGKVVAIRRGVRILTPSTGWSGLRRVLGLVLCHVNICRRLVLRIHELQRVRGPLDVALCTLPPGKG